MLDDIASLSTDLMYQGTAPLTTFLAEDVMLLDVRGMMIIIRCSSRKNKICEVKVIAMSRAEDLLSI